MKHNVYSESWSFMGQHTHRSDNTHFGPRAQRSIFPMLYPLTLNDTHWDIWVCVSWKSFCNAHPPLHGLRIPLDTHHVQMIFFTPLHVVQTHSHHTLCRYRSHTFPQAATPISVFEALLRWASSMMFNTDASKVRMRSPPWAAKRSAVGTTTFHGIADFNPLFYQMKNRCCTHFIQTLKPAVSTFYNMVKSGVQHIANRMFTYYSIICHPSVFFTP